ncbi:unnamed protein product, partial [Allacma fusca]
EVDHNQ